MVRLLSCCSQSHPCKPSLSPPPAVVAPPTPTTHTSVIPNTCIQLLIAPGTIVRRRYGRCYIVDGKGVGMGFSIAWETLARLHFRHACWTSKTSGPRLPYIESGNRYPPVER